MSERNRKHDDLENPLGVAHEPISSEAHDHLRPADAHAQSRRRRARALGEDGIDRHSTGMGDMNVDPDGAAGIDMGYGGEGTDIKSNS